MKIDIKQIMREQYQNEIACLVADKDYSKAELVSDSYAYNDDALKQSLQLVDGVRYGQNLILSDDTIDAFLDHLINNGNLYFGDGYHVKGSWWSVWHTDAIYGYLPEFNMTKKRIDTINRAQDYGFLCSDGITIEYAGSYYLYFDIVAEWSIFCIDHKLAISTTDGVNITVNMGAN